MKKFGIALLLVIAAVAGCAQDPKKQIIGKWKAVDGSGSTMDFLASGDLVMSTKGNMPMVNTMYEVVDPKHLKVIIKIDISGLPKAAPGQPDLSKAVQDITMVADMALENDKLTLTFPNQKPQVLERVSADDAAAASEASATATPPAAAVPAATPPAAAVPPTKADRPDTSRPTASEPASSSGTSISIDPKLRRPPGSKN